MITTIIFDAFGTLVKVTNGASARQIISYIRDEGKIVNEAEFISEWKNYYKRYTSSDVSFMTERDIFISRIDMFYKRYGISRSAENDADLQLSEANYRELYEEVTEALGELKGKYNIFIGSNTDNSVLEQVMKKNNVSVDRIYTSENLKCYKPSKSFYLSILDDAGLKPEEVLFVGDSFVDDVLGPQNIGMKTCWVNRNNGVVDKYTPNYIVTNLMEIVCLL